MIELWVIFIIWGIVCYKIGSNKKRGIRVSQISRNVRWVNNLLMVGFTREQCRMLINDLDQFIDEYEIIIKQKTGQ